MRSTAGAVPYHNICSICFLAKTWARSWDNELRNTQNTRKRTSDVCCICFSVFGVFRSFSAGVSLRLGCTTMNGFLRFLRRFRKCRRNVRQRGWTRDFQPRNGRKLRKWDEMSFSPRSVSSVSSVVDPSCFASPFGCGFAALGIPFLRWLNRVVRTTSF
jgi:hypothetical protein